MLNNLFRNLEQWEKHEPSSFWLCSFSLYIIFSAIFNVLFPGSLSHQSHVVIEQVRGGGMENFLFPKKEEKFDLEFHRHLEQNFPDWPERMEYQKKQEKFLRSAMRRKREMLRLRMIQTPKTYTKEEEDAMDYFQGNGMYAEYQDEKKQYNIFDTRQSFLLKMHNDELRNRFLNNLNSRNN